MRAARAQGRRTVDQLRGIREIQRRGGHVGDAEGFGYGGAHTGGGIFVQRGKVGGPLAEDGQGKAVLLRHRAEGFLNQRLQLLKHKHRILAAQEFQQGVFRQRPRHAEAEHGHGIRKAAFLHGIKHIVDRGTAGDHAEARIRRAFHTVERAGVAHRNQAAHTLDQTLVMAHGIARQRHERVILFIVARPGLGADVAKLHHAAAVRHAGGRPNHHGHPHLRRKCERSHGHILHFLRGGGFEAGKPEQAGILPIILLVLAGEHARVVGAVHHEAPTDAEIRQRAERIGGDVEADVLHGGQTVQAAHGRARNGFHRHFLVGGEIHAETARALQFVQQVAHFRGRGAGIAARVVEPGFIRAPHERLVAHEQRLFADFTFEKH